MNNFLEARATSQFKKPLASLSPHEWSQASALAEQDLYEAYKDHPTVKAYRGY